MLTTELLTSFMACFLGYGNLDANLWFIGMEEGGGHTEAEVQGRLDAWNDRGRLEVDDVAGFHVAINQPQWFQQGAPTQNTWRQIIRSILRSQGQLADLDTIRAYQIERFARTNGQVATLELMPLPSPSTRDWNYHNWSNLTQLANRETYYRSVMPARIQMLQEKLRVRAPRAVVFYGAGYQAHWQAISGCEFGNGNFPRVVVNGHTTFLVLPHPTAHPFGGVTATQLFTSAGERLENLHLFGN